MILLLALSLLLVSAVGGTLAYLHTRSETVTNTFTVGAVACQVNAESGGYTVTNAAGNQSNIGTLINAYIRVAVVANWKSASDPSVVYGSPIMVDVGGANWKESGGYYYYTKAVEPDMSTEILNVSLTGTNPDATKYMASIQILAEAIQADGVDETGKKAVVAAWGVDPADLQ